jgi:D-beta-D-heptose 7-phosphate kinase/D-beta-D-heptose 1-phosphate adenosyltransferase
MKEIDLPPEDSEASRPRLLVVGDVMLDRVVCGESSRLSVEAPVPIVVQRDESTRPGGAANVAVNLAVLGARVTLAGAVGLDPEADRLRALVRAAGVDELDLVACGDRPTTAKTRLVAHRQQVARVDRERTEPVTSEDAARLLEGCRGALAGCQAVVVPDYGKGVVSGELWRGLVEVARAAGIPVMVDPSPQRRLGFYRGAEVIKPNWTEAVRAARQEGEDDLSPDAIGERLLAASGAACIVVTRGERGLSVFRPGQARYDAHALRREVYDVTGAGDTVMATLAWARAAGMAMEESAWLANLAGGLAVERFGAATIGRRELVKALVPEAGLREKVIPRAEIEAFLASHRQAGRCIVFTNGCFDLLHAGHLRLLRRCAACGDVLVIGLNSDASVRALKGAERPIVGEEDRALVLAALPEVDAVVLFDEPTPDRIIAQILPDVLVKGGDYAPDEVVGRDLVESHGGRLELVPLRRGISTSEIVRRIRLLPEDEPGPSEGESTS